jgi:hypothetical protein
MEPGVIPLALSGFCEGNAVPRFFFPAAVWRARDAERDLLLAVDPRKPPNCLAPAAVLTRRSNSFVPLAPSRPTRENEPRSGARFLALPSLSRGRIAVAENQIPEQKNNLIIRVPLSSDGYVSIYFSSNDGRLMSEREWWHLKQVIELASKAFVKTEERAQAAAAGA